ncbi:hypothetical protein [Streptomyces sp. NPDC096033]
MDADTDREPSGQPAQQPLILMVGELADRSLASQNDERHTENL